MKLLIVSLLVALAISLPTDHEEMVGMLTAFPLGCPVRGL